MKRPFHAAWNRIEADFGEKSFPDIICLYYNSQEMKNQANSFSGLFSRNRKATGYFFPKTSSFPGLTPFSGMNRERVFRTSGDAVCRERHAVVRDRHAADNV